MTTKTIQEELLNERIAGLSPTKRALLELKLKKHASRSTANDLISRRSQYSPAPLSFAQQRLWFLSQLEPDSPAYNMPIVRRLSGQLDAKALEQALGEIVRRHESLRTRFENVGGVPQQVVDEAGEWKLKLVDLTGKDKKAQTAAAQQIASDDAKRPFALAQEWGIRAQLLRLDYADHILVLTMHHIVSDGWSLGVFFGELQRLYEAYSRGACHSPLPELRLQYADFAVWQQDWLGGAELQKQLSYWKEQLTGVIPVELPLDKPRPASPSYRGEKQLLRLSADLSRELQALARPEGATLFMVMFAAFQVLLSRYSGQMDISVGTPIANRNRAQLEELIGTFVNTLVLRTDLSGDPSFAELLERVREVALAGYAHQDLPFEKLVDELHPERSLSRNPVFDVIFAMQNAPRSEGQLGDLRLEPWGEGSKTTRMDLEVHVWETVTGLVCTFVYATDLFQAATIHRLMGHYEELLRAVVADPARRLSELPLLTSEEREQLRQWNQTSSTYPQQCIQELFEAQAQQQSSAIAVRCAADELSYAELNARANQLAHYLRAHGVGPEMRVGICLERSVDLVIGLLGILKAGGAYLPLDANYPAERLSFMLHDAQPSLILTKTEFLSQLPNTDVKIVCLNTDSNLIARESTDNPHRETTLENLAYVMYTSGSTGYPKGVSVTHRNVVRLVKENNYASLNANEVFLQFAPLTFDASTLEIWGALLNGAQLVVFPPYAPTLAELGRTIEENKVSTLWLTAGLFHQFVDEYPQSLTSIRQLLAGGDVLSVPHVEKALRFMNGNRLINGYGPTENTTFTCCHLIKSSSNRSIPIGRPLANTQVYVLDANYQPVPVGVPGELYVGGDGLARGYLNRPDQTAEKFLPNMFSARPGARLYRTGDIVRHLPDGDLEFIGRADQQLKIRGFRIEPGEIEYVLAQHPKVAKCAISAATDHVGEKVLVAYVVLAEGLKLEASDLRPFLRAKLPEYMLPTAFVFMDALPLTDNGKVDRSQLPAPAEGRPESSGTFVAPRTDLEQEMAEIWEQVLNVKGVGIYDNFFDLGGHSLLAVRLVSQIEKKIGQRLPLVSFFQGPNIEYLASLLSQDVRSLAWPTLIEIQKGGESVPLFCVSHPNVNALGYRSLARHLGPDQTVFGLQSQLTEDLEGEYSQAAVDQLATEYLEALRAYRPTGPYQFVGLCRGAHIAHEMARRLEQEGQQVALLGILDTWVGENTYSYYWFVEHYWNRLTDLARVGLKEQLRVINKKTRAAVTNVGKHISTLVRTGSVRRNHNPLYDVYFPGPDFVPRTYEGRITVFRVPKQPRTRIRDQYLGWSKLAKGGVDVHIISGRHSDVLKEPHVQSLAAELQKYLLHYSEQ